MAALASAHSETPAASFAVVTLLTSDSYLAGALTTLKSLLDVEGSSPEKSFETVCLVTPSTVGQSSIKALEKCFDRVIGVEEITTSSWTELDLLGRRDLSASLTKLHIFRLTQYTKILFLDADTLVLRPLSHLFALPASFSAAPDSGWPDAFNSGVMVAAPSQETFEALIKMMGEKGSWDGGDQGLLNDFFPDWNRLSFTYNVTPSAYYTYAPAYRRHGETSSVLHFIGRDKPWTRGSRAVYVPEAAQNDYYDLVGKWYDVFERHFGTGLTHDVASRVVNPPASFKSSYTDLPSRVPLPPSTIIASPVPVRGPTDVVTWDPARSSPPHDPTDLQMRDSVDIHYDNIWDDPNKSRQRIRFQQPTSYPSVPVSTHEWYQSVMVSPPNPSAVRPVFPWEERAAAAAAAAEIASPFNSSRHPPSRKFPADEAPRPLPIISSGITTNYTPSSTVVSPTFSNAWDAIPGIGRYAKAVAKSTASRERPSVESTEKRSSEGGTLGESWKSSLKEMRAYEKRGETSSRDGDDEDEEDINTEEEEEERDRVPIRFKARSGSGSSDMYGALNNISPTVGMSRSGSEDGSGGDFPDSSSTKSRKESRNLPTSPRSHRASVHERRSSASSTGSTNSTGSTGTVKDPSPTYKILRLNPPPVSQQTPTSPRLATQAIRNSAAARLSASGQGNGNGPPLVRATRVFSPETDTGTVKEQGLAALQRFVEREAEEARNGGGGSGGAFKY